MPKETEILSTADRLRHEALRRAGREFQIQLIIEIAHLHPEVGPLMSADAVYAIAPDRTDGLIDAFRVVTTVLDRFHHPATANQRPARGLQ